MNEVKTKYDANRMMPLPTESYGKIFLRNIMALSGVACKAFIIGGSAKYEQKERNFGHSVQSKHDMTGTEGAKIMGTKVWLALILEAIVFAVLLFGSAGTIDWPPAWALLFIFFGVGVYITAQLARRDPALLAERMRPFIQKGQPLWDKVFMSTVSVLFVVWFITMGLDRRYHGATMPVWAEVVGAMALAASMFGFEWAARANTFLAPVVRIQTERDHHVVSTGAYAVVRHPLYASSLVFFPSTALLLGSCWGMAGAVALIAAIIVRTVMEDRELHRNLAGYKEYASRVRYRLIPFIW